MSLLKGNRHPAVAGTFYPDKKDSLFEEIHRAFTSELGPGTFPSKSEKSASTLPGCFVVPHAGYMYSGPIAAHSYFRMAAMISSSRDRSVIAIIIGPNHYGVGSGIALSKSETWETPLGLVKVNHEISKKIMKESSNIIDIDSESHSREHSIEVQIPFLQTISALRKVELEIVPICLMLQDRESAEQVSKSILRVIEGNPSKFLMVASSDLTHYEPEEAARTNDMKLIEAIKRTNVVEFYKVLERYNVSACGYGAIATVMYVAKGLGKKEGKLLKYATSGGTTGDRSSVVGYSAVEFV